jgi:hypothetical protein
MFFLADMEVWASLRSAATSSLASTLAAFAVILILTRLRCPLAVSILAGAILFDVLFGCGAVEVLRRSLAGAAQPQSIGLLCVVVTMLVLSETMRRAGQLDRIVALAKSFLRRPAVTMAALPALIGLMPMPGGAHLSAPMVESAAGDTEVSPDRLSAINYWFRHLWEFWWPLYPGVMVALSVTHSDIGEFVPYQLPLSVFMAASGLLLFRKSHPDLHRSAPRAAAGEARKLLRATSTIWVIPLVWAAVRLMVRLTLPAPAGGGALATAGRYGPLVIGLAVSLAWTMRMNRMGGGDLLAVLKRPSIYRLAAVVISVMVFWYAVKQAGAARRIAAELNALRVPPEIVVALLPLIAGLVTGLAVAFVGTSFPIVLAIAAEIPDQPSLRPYIVLAYAFGHMGQMLSPLHICQVLSNEYFQASPRAVYRRILPPAAITLALAIAYFLLLRAALG